MYDLTKESRAGRPRQLDRQILADQRCITRDHHDFESPRLRLKQPAAPRRLLDENFTALTKELEVPLASSSAHHGDQPGEPIARNFIGDTFAHRKTRCRRALPRRELERVRVVEANGF